MTLMTRGGKTRTKAHADPRRSRSFVLYFYKTIGGRTEIRIHHRKQDRRTGRWAILDPGEIFKSGIATVARIRELLATWE